MALIGLKEFWQEGGEETSYGDFRRGNLTTDYIQERTHVRVFQAEDSDPTRSSQAVLADAISTGVGAVTVPAVWALHPADSLAKLTRHRIRRNSQSPNFHTITCVYETAPKPIDEPADIEWGDGSNEFVLNGAYAFIDPETGEEFLPTDAPYPGRATNSNNYPITISTRQVPDPPPVDQEHYRILTVKKNFNYKPCAGTGTGSGTEPAEIAVTPDAGFERRLVDLYYSRRINSAPFVVPGECVPIPIGQAFLAERPRARRAFRNNIQYWETTWVFWVRERGWNLIIADLGFHRFKNHSDPTSPLVNIFIHGQRAVNPQRLDGFGNPLAVNLPPVFLEYRVRDYADFNSLALFG